MDIEIISGFLGAGKTTFLNQYLPLLKGKTVVIENEFGDIGLDGDLIQSDIPVREINAGCICCSLVLDFRQEIKIIVEQFAPDRIIIEPSGVARLSDIIKACQKTREKDGVPIKISKRIVIVDAEGFDDYAEDFGEFYLDQIRQAELVLLSNLEELPSNKIINVIEKIKAQNVETVIYQKDWRQLEGQALLDLLELAGEYGGEDKEQKQGAAPIPADKVFTSVALTGDGIRSEEEVKVLLRQFGSGAYGNILRAKGIIPAANNKMIHINFTPTYSRYEYVQGGRKNKVVIIGYNLKEEALKELLNGEVL